MSTAGGDDDGPWDKATEHDPAEPSDDASLDGEDPPTTRASIAQQARIRAASRAPVAVARTTPSTLPPPGPPERLPASALPDVASAPSHGLAIVAHGTDAHHVRTLCQTAGVAIPIIAAAGSAPSGTTRIIVIGEPALPVPPRVVHIARSRLADDALLALVRALLGGNAVGDPPVAAADADADARAADFAQRIATLDDGGTIEQATAEAVTALAGADRVRVLVFPPAAPRPVAGIVGWCAYTGHAVHASPAGDDARYLTELDDPDGKPQSRIVVQPVFDADRRVVALLVAVRRWRRNDFTDAERDTLRSFAALVGPAFAAAATGAPRPITTATSTGTVAPKRSATEPPITGASATMLAAAAQPSTSATLPAVPLGAGATTTGMGVVSERSSASDLSGRHTSRKSTGSIDPIDIAIVATDDDGIARIKRIAKKARLEVSVLSRAEDAPPYYRIITLGQPWTPDTDRRVAYAARSSITDEQLVALVVGLAADRAPAALVVSKPQTPAEAKRVQLAFAGSRRLGNAATLADAETLAIAAVRELVDADRAYCVFYTSDDGALWSEVRRRARGDDRRAIAGVVGWVARTGRATSVERAAADPRYLGPLDDPDGDPNSQLLVQPIIASDRTVLGALVAVRRPKRPAFVELDITVLERFAALASPLIEQMQLATATRSMLRGGDAESDDGDASGALARWLRALPRWTYAIGGALLALAIVAATRC